MLALTDATLERVRALFPSEAEEIVVRLLEQECGNNLPFSEDDTPETAERVRYAVLKLSKGNLSALRNAIAEAKVDWRDVLAWSGFGDDPQAHLQWRP
jgi:hypothetical protein